MFLRRIDPDEPDYDRRTFECAMCDYTKTTVNGFPSSQVTRWKAMGRRSCYAHCPPMRSPIAPKVVVIGQYQFGKYQRPL